MLPVVRGDRETARQIVLLHGRAGRRRRSCRSASASSGSSTACRRSCSARVFAWMALAALARADAAARGGALPLLAALPRAALRRDGRRRGRLMSDDPPSRCRRRSTSTPGPRAAQRCAFIGWSLLVVALAAVRRDVRDRARVPPARLARWTASSSRSSSPATGIRLAVKDLFDTAGVRTTYGSAVFAEHVPAETAEAVRRLEAAGYANVGKANLHEFAYGVTSQNLHYGTVPNPAAPGRTRAARAAARRRRSRPGSSTRRSAPTPAARSASRPRAAAIAGFKPTLRARADRRRLPARAELRPRRADGARRRAAASS